MQVLKHAEARGNGACEDIVCDTSSTTSMLNLPNPVGIGPEILLLASQITDGCAERLATELGRRPRRLFVTLQILYKFFFFVFI